MNVSLKKNFAPLFWQSSWKQRCVLQIRCIKST